MSDTKWTPGPWSFRGCDGGWAIDFNDDQEQVVDVVYEEADARLIAAAPDLFEALERVVKDAEQSAFEEWLNRVCPSGDVESVHGQWGESIDCQDFNDEWDGVIAALAKARGEK